LQRLLLIFTGIILTTDISPAATQRPVQTLQTQYNQQPVAPAAEPESEIETGPSEAEKESLIAELSGAVRQLQDDLSQMDMEIKRCERARSNWRAATIVGSVGVIGTATGAIIQSVQLNKAKKESNAKSPEKPAEAETKK
jgi:hypothetical protein